MANAQAEVLAFFNEWQPTLGDMLASMERRFTAQTVWENVGISKTTGFAEAKAFMDGFAQMYPIESGEVIVHHVASTGNVVLTERTDTFYDKDGKQIVSLQLMGIFEMDGEKILSWRDYFDTVKGFG
ncbi:limonene-1,2-epoxide hydrolase family protein [Croceicoccus sp. F390]|uniref:Limonene-1,2-epoxide hydrolase family protein n=1 Tax=Croceicoccus esteveae TaxID=3075597 RepID=A0ABU2ZI67_9SPHN|nr:limonene-1,2-epoxide hydrolase family protein [Croceicoccus sp. F390]MDT0576294.1 limonene-1,2-epoxide hydrolase family protein [Croceicoccus sp. F390]